MTDHGSKQLVFNKSTLFNLKAELLRKQSEVKGKKQLPQHKVENFTPPTVKKPDAESSARSKKTFKDNLKVVDNEELEACRKTKAALEKKAELYEHLADSAGQSQLAGQYLVDFDTKKQQDARTLETIQNPEQYDVFHKDGENDEWTEFTDSLGRTRKCLKSDLEYYLSQDKNLVRTQVDDEDIGVRKDMSQKPFLVQKTNDYLQSLRKKWEQKENELLAKSKDVHYQDLLFDEARMHGVGYFQFSTDETERRQQMADLERLRSETLAAQKAAEEQRIKQEKLIEARVAATRARLRLRAGLPPEEPKDDKQQFTDKLLKYLQQQRDEAENKAKEIDRIIREEQERERERLRQAHVRDWDVGKEGVDEKLYKFKEVSQEEYVEEQRNKRINEFAPPQSASSSKSNYAFDDSGKKVTSEKSVTVVREKTWHDVRPRPKTPPPPQISEPSLYSVCNKTKRNMKYKNFARETEPTLIVDELEEEGESFKRAVDKRKASSNHSEIAAPPTYEYYGPNAKQFRGSQKPFDSDLKEAFEQGTKSLETKPQDKRLSSKYDFTFD